MSTEATMSAQQQSSPQAALPHVLAIDDDPTIRELMADYLGQNGFRVTAVADGRAMSAVLANEVVDLIVLDLKLQAEDGCNLLYAMWRIAPKPGLVVSLKRNPGMHSSGDCGNGGYTNLKPRRGTRVPAFLPGERHAIRAEQRGEELRVLVDGAPAWEGTLPPDALSLRGPSGFRSDNGRFDLELFASPR